MINNHSKTQQDPADTPLDRFAKLIADAPADKPARNSQQNRAPSIDHRSRFQPSKQESFYGPDHNGRGSKD